MSRRSFDIERWCAHAGVDLHEHGEANVASGWVNIACPFCPDGDPSWHLGMNVSSSYFSCYRCNFKGPPWKVIARYEKCSSSQARIIQENFSSGILTPSAWSSTKPVDYSKKVLPELLEPTLPTCHRRYLESRGFDPRRIVPEYDLRGVHQFGKYAWRIIAPIVVDGHIVNFVARDVSGVADNRYLACPDEQAILPRNEILYNIDTVRDSVIVVEGVTDVWRMGPGAVAVLGVRFTDAQVNLLARKKLKRAVILFDGEPAAADRARQLAWNLSGIVPDVEVALLPEGDPGDLSDEEAQQIKRELI